MTAEQLAQRMAWMKQRKKRVSTFCFWFGVALLVGSPVRAASGEELFAKNCASCHGKDGKAQTPIARKLGVKDLTQSKATDGEIERQVTEGKKDDRGNLKMPPFKDKLSPAEIKSLIVLVKSFRQ